jgi:choline-sulfatase
VEPTNLVFIMTDEHSPKALGCAGHPIVRTPNLDALAASGARFASAYANCPICVPSRSSFSTGRWVHQVGSWDNAHPYDGRVPGWGHRLQAAGRRVSAIGKLHFRNALDPTGFDEQLHPMHVVDGVGDLLGSIRDELPYRHASKKYAEQVGPGESSYSRYDREIAGLARGWLEKRAAEGPGRPWMLYVSFVCPHFPLIAPPEFCAMYPPEEMPLPKLHRMEESGRHPWIRALRGSYAYDDFFSDDERRRLAIASYYALVSFVDDNVGRVLGALRETGLDRTTRVIYASDHGESLGARGVWGKSNLYEESAGIPLIVAGPDVPEGKVCWTPVSLVDGYPSILECLGVTPDPEDTGRPGRSLFQTLSCPDDPGRWVFSEYHAAGAKTAAYMLRRGRFKYIHYVDFPPELFDLEADPEELHDLAPDAAHQGAVREFEALLRGILDPEETDRRAKRDQAALVERHGGREAIINRGTHTWSPAPGEKAERTPPH